MAKSNFSFTQGEPNSNKVSVLFELVWLVPNTWWWNRTIWHIFGVCLLSQIPSSHMLMGLLRCTEAGSKQRKYVEICTLSCMTFCYLENWFLVTCRLWKNPSWGFLRRDSKHMESYSWINALCTFHVMILILQPWKDGLVTITMNCKILTLCVSPGCDYILEIFAFFIF